MCSDLETYDINLFLQCNLVNYASKIIMNNHNRLDLSNAPILW
jgi:hypothetical protein